MVFRKWVDILPTFINMFDKHARKMKTICHIWAKREKEFYVNKKCNHAKNEVTYS